MNEVLPEPSGTLTQDNQENNRNDGPTVATDENGIQEILKPSRNPTSRPDYETPTGPKIARLYAETIQLHVCECMM